MPFPTPCTKIPTFIDARFFKKWVGSHSCHLALHHFHNMNEWKNEQMSGSIKYFISGSFTSYNLSKRIKNWSIMTWHNQLLKEGLFISIHLPVQDGQRHWLIDWLTVSFFPPKKRWIKKQNKHLLNPIPSVTIPRWIYIYWDMVLSYE